MKQDWTSVLRAMNRQFMQAVWQKAKNRRLDELDESEKQIAMIMLDHAAEFRSRFEQAAAVEGKTVDEEEINPFMHICLHAVVENQLAEREPPEVYHFYQAMIKKKCGRHDALHLIANILFPMVFRVLRSGKEFDLETYCAILNKMKNRKPEKIPELVEEELYETGYFDDLELEFETVESSVAAKELDGLIDDISSGGTPKILRSKNGGRAVLFSLEEFELFLEEKDEHADGDEEPDAENRATASPQAPPDLDRNFARVYRFRITLEETEPRIWRLIEVPENYTFWDLHVAIQDAMGWQDNHLHRFEIHHPKTGQLLEIGIPGMDETEETTAAGWRYPISELFSLKHPAAEYLYDFGDDWRHSVVLEEILERRKSQKYPRCLEGQGACPPEDCGGIPGFYDLLAVLQDKEHPEYDEILEWVGRKYDPAVFDPRKVVFWDPRKRWRMAFD
ncbi:MAG: DUF1841 family protein [Thermodesulfobacteriota bacterium]